MTERAIVQFTSFVGYEWTGAAYSGNNLHRNIIFDNSNVPMAPVSFYEAPTRKELWNLLDQTCSENCDYVVIPHNSNLSNGYMFEEPDQDEILNPKHQRAAGRDLSAQRKFRVQY